MVIVSGLALRDIITRRAGVALGPSRHYRKRGCVQFVLVPSNFSEFNTWENSNHHSEDMFAVATKTNKSIQTNYFLLTDSRS